MHEERLPLRVAGEDSWKSLQATAKSPAALDEEVKSSGTSSGKGGGCDTASLLVGKVVYSPT